MKLFNIIVHLLWLRLGKVSLHIFLNRGFKTMMSHKQRLICLAFLALSSHNVVAWDGMTNGHIRTIDVTGGNNYGFRVSLEGGPPLCGNSHTWAYINETDSNYQTYVAVLLAAKAAKQSVTLYTNRQNNASDGFCHIGYISVN